MITQYHRPSSVDDAVDLLQKPGSVPLGGGTVVTVLSDHTSTTVVDLQDLDIAGITTIAESTRIGAMARLQDLVESSVVPPVIRELAHREAPNTIRNAATIGGTIGAMDPESELLAGLLAFGASVTVTGTTGSTEHPLDGLLDDPGLLEGAIITSVSVPSGGVAAADRTARTPRDQPIVAAVAHRDDNGATVIAMSGVAGRPVIVDPDALEDLDPPADFRGSGEYRKHLALVLARRVADAVEGGAST